ncbi:MAG: glycosyltransferase family 2 protein, partial [Thermomicrobiales bacterium]|nr:glycosyltransferase family 2 protein [Thermomicrobiales bacterium]
MAEKFPGRKHRSSALPLVSCLCLTYRRPPRDQYLLEEAIESFLRQTYPHKELIVLNDSPEQVLACDAPGVRVVNTANRCNSAGEKRNLAVALARGELLAPWDDDDISLPWRLEVSVARLGGADYYSPGKLWVSRAGELQHEPIRYFAHVASVFSRRGFQHVGGYRAISFGEDLRLDAALRTQAQLSPYADPNDHSLSPQDLFYLYRAGASANHLSRVNNPFRWDEIGSRPLDQGHFTLRPHWRTDYVALTCRQVVLRTRAEAQDPAWDDTVLLVGNLPRVQAAPPAMRGFALPEAGPGESAKHHRRR